MINRFNPPSRMSAALALCTLAALGVVAFTAAQEGAAAPPSPAAKALPAPAGKIGFYDRKRILDACKKRFNIDEAYAKLQDDLNRQQKDIDVRSTAIEKEKDEYARVKSSLPPAAQDSREEKIQGMYEEYKVELAGRQADIDEKERVMMKEVADEIDRVAARVGAQQGCTSVQALKDRVKEPHAPDDLPAERVSSPNIDITSHVTDAINRK